ncbi:MAG: glucokinase [Proteobacteria bacterium]|nr:glucokinase [Pseudomonadota bacterium]
MRLLADIGGTHARFALQAAAGAPLTQVRTLVVAAYPSFQTALHDYLTSAGQPVLQQAAIGIACPVTGDVVAMTNAPWTFSIAAMRADLGLERLVATNDFTALALGLPSLAAHEVHRLAGSGNGPHPAHAVCALIGPGTGLGVSGLVPQGAQGWRALSGLGGHVTLAATTPREWAVAQWLTARFGHASAERVLSGQGLENLHRALAELDGEPATPAPSAAEVLAGDTARCREARALFCAWLGQVAGDLMLTLGAVGGVYVGGGIVPRMLAELEQSTFLARLQNKGRFSDYVAAAPVWVVTAAASPALLGAARMLDQPSTGFAGVSSSS